MAFQSKVNILQALGKPGTISRLNPVPQHLPMIAEGVDVKAGSFCFAGTNPELQVIGINDDATAVEGLVIFERYQPALSGFDDTLVVNEGEEVAVLKKGCAYVVSSTDATKGQLVLVEPSNGVISTADKMPTAGEGEDPITVINTGWVVETGGNANGVCEIMCL